MFKLMIVEDEKRIREGLATGFDWESLGFKISNTAANGAEALAFYKENPPDVIMTDIRMPVMDGFELMDTIHRDNRRIKFIVLSGYDSFEYAQKSIRFGVTSYLLKPVSENDLYPLMKNLHDDLSLQQKKLVGEANKSLLLKLSKQETLDNKIQKLLYGNSTEFRHAEDLLADVLPGFNPGRMSLCVVALPNAPNIGNVCKALSKYGNDRQQYFQIDGDSIVCLLGVDEASPPDLEAQIAKGIREEIARYLSDRQAAENMVVVLGRPFSGISHIRSSYREALDLMKYSFYSTNGEVVRHPVLPKKSELARNKDVVSILSNAIAEDSEVDLQIRLREFLTACAAQFMPKDILAFKIMDIYLMTAKKIESSLTHSMDEKEIFEKLSMQATFDGFSKQADLLFQGLLEHHRQSQITSAQPIIKKIENYINKNYGENLSLNSLAETFHINASYLSSLFCKKTNVPLTNYIRNVRIENAKRLLASSNDSVNEIARQVGYKEYRHFCTVFKNEVGKTPKGYRLYSAINKQSS